MIERRIPNSGALVCLDLSPQNRWHLHGLFLVPTTCTPEKLIRFWRRLWPRGSRPSPKAQLARPLETNDLPYVLRHHLRGPRRIPNLPTPIPSMADRITASGAFRQPWLKLLPWVKGHRLHPPRKWARSPPRRLKASTNPATPYRARYRQTSFPRTVPPGCCFWCAGKLPAGCRRDVRFHAGCRRSACRAVAHRSERVKALVAHIEQGLRLLRRDALRVAESIAINYPKTEGPLRRSFVFKLFPRCTCGQPLALRFNATTCGQRRCRHNPFKKYAAWRPQLEVRTADLRPLATQGAICVQ